MADLSIRYAAALFELSQEAGLRDAYLEQAALLRNILIEDKAMDVLAHPLISAEEKFTFLDEAFGGSLHPDLFGFLKLTVTKNRENYILPALQKLVDMIRESQNQTTARVITAVPLTEEQSTGLSTVLSRKLKKRVDLNEIVDPTVVAGISIHVDGCFMDRTVKTMLKSMKENVRKGAEE